MLVQIVARYDIGFDETGIIEQLAGSDTQFCQVSRVEPNADEVMSAFT